MCCWVIPVYICVYASDFKDKGVKIILELCLECKNLVKNFQDILEI